MKRGVGYAKLVKAISQVNTGMVSRAAAALLTSRSGLLPTMAETPQADTGDWELVTWLVVMNAKQEST